MEGTELLVPSHFRLLCKSCVYCRTVDAPRRRHVGSKEMRDQSESRRVAFLGLRFEHPTQHRARFP